MAKPTRGPDPPDPVPDKAEETLDIEAMLELTEPGTESAAEAAETFEELRLRLPSDDQGWVGTKEGIVMGEGFDQMRIDDLGGCGRRRLRPTRRDDGRVLGRSEDILDLEPIVILPCGIQLRRFGEGLRRLPSATHFVEDLRPVFDACRLTVADDDQVCGCFARIASPKRLIMTLPAASQVGSI